MGSIAARISEQDEQSKIVQHITNYIANITTQNYSLKFRVLAAFFACFPENSPSRLIIWKILVKLADESNRPSVLLIYLINIDKFLEQWNLTPKEGVQTYISAINLLGKNPEK